MELVVTNFNSDATKADLKRLFGKYGRVKRVIIWIDHFDGYLNNDAYVDMPCDREARKAIKKPNGRWWHDLPLDVNEAKM